MKAATEISILCILSLPLQAQLLPVDSIWVEQTLRQMTLEEKIGQLIMPAHLDMNQSLDWIQRLKVGSFWIAKSEARTIATELNQLQQSSKYPLLISADFEKGAGTHIDGATDLPVNMALGASRNPQAAYRAAALTAKEARAIGVHIDFAPVVDVNNNPNNPIINIRSYGEDQKLVSVMAVTAIKGYQENGLLATAKHFPGHGNTSVDSHSKLGMVESTPAEFQSVELYPYREALKKTDLAAIMTAHLWVRPIDDDTIPATLSRNAIHGLLRQQLGFSGIIFPDALIMGGITSRYSLDEATVKTIQAGCDIILWPGNPATSFEALEDAVQKGIIGEDRINESVRRILQAKTRVGLQKSRFVGIDKIADIVGTPAQYEEAKRISAECLTLVKDDTKLLPLSANKKTLVLTMSTRSRNAMMSRTLVSFPSDMAKLNSRVDTLLLSENLNQAEVTKALTLAEDAEVVVLGAYVRIVIGSGTVELPETHKNFINQLLQKNKNVVLISFGNPYISSSFPSLSTYICAYDNAKALQEVAAEALYGKITFKGKLPVTIK